MRTSVHNIRLDLTWLNSSTLSPSRQEWYRIERNATSCSHVKGRVKEETLTSTSRRHTLFPRATKAGRVNGALASCKFADTAEVPSRHQSLGTPPPGAFGLQRKPESSLTSVSFSVITSSVDWTTSSSPTPTFPGNTRLRGRNTFIASSGSTH